MPTGDLDSKVLPESADWDPFRARAGFRLADLGVATHGITPANGFQNRCPPFEPEGGCYFVSIEVAMAALGCCHLIGHHEGLIHLRQWPLHLKNQSSLQVRRSCRRAQRRSWRARPICRATFSAWP